MRRSLHYRLASFLQSIVSGRIFAVPRSVLEDKWKEAMSSILPIAAAVLVLCFAVVPMPSSALLSFLFGGVLIIFGMGLFNLGTEMAMSPIGEAIGAALTKSRRTELILAAGFLVGTAVTMSEPDLTVLAGQVQGIPSMLLIVGVAIGVGLFLMLALARILYGIKMRLLLWIVYGAVFLLTAFVPRNFLPVAFDAGGVTTGPMTVPFILALGIGVSAMRQDAGAEKDSFGLVALCSVGPILTVMLLSIIFRPEDSQAQSAAVMQGTQSMELFHGFLEAIPEYMKEVGIALLPIVVIFVFFQVRFLHLQGRALKRILLGFFYTFSGLVVFLQGANVGFMPAGSLLGQLLGEKLPLLLIPVGMVIGWYTVSAEPAVQVLCDQVYDMTAGAVPKRAMSTSLSVGVSLSVGLSMLRIVTDTPLIRFLIPGYAIALLLTFLVPPVFTSIAFDSGGVASGPMTATFLLPFAMGACQALGRGSDSAFGIVSMVAMTPLIAIQLLGLIFARRMGHEEAPAVLEEIIEL